MYRAQGYVKLGCSSHPYERVRNYLTGCPPGFSPSADIVYDAIWETNAQTQKQLENVEARLHNEFIRHRCMRSRPGDSEWFCFHGVSSPLDRVASWIEKQPWMVRRVPVEELKRLSRPHTTPPRFLQQLTRTNVDYLDTDQERLARLQEFQAPVISALADFFASPTESAGYVIAPCGSGKTIMTVRAMRSHGGRRTILCCPSSAIQQQWYETLCAEGVYQPDQMLLLGTQGTTDPVRIRAHLKKDVWCILTTYDSSHLLVDLLPTSGTDLLVLDEAHHMAGKVAEGETGEGRTRRLLAAATTLGIKRLSLTYTPRLIVDANTDAKEESRWLSMDDIAVFGPCLAELKIRELIGAGVLPDYRLWTLRDETQQGTGLLGKAACLVEAWKATEYRRVNRNHDMLDRDERVEVPILNHLVVFAATVEDATQLTAYFRDPVTGVGMDTEVIHVKSGDILDDVRDDLTGGIKIKGIKSRFTAAPRAILVNCFVLDEGVDLPIANAVAIMYPKQARGQITQMVLRAGRWYPEKPVFHVLIPIVGDEDMTGLEEVLMALASCDDKIRDEILLHGSHASAAAAAASSCSTVATEISVLPECIMIEEYDAKDIRQCFENIRRNMFPGEKRQKKESYRVIREENRMRGLRSKKEYLHDPTHTPRIPAPKEYFQDSGWISWYHFLGIDTTAFPPTKHAWVEECKRRAIRSWEHYAQVARTDPTLPLHPEEMYEDFTYWSREMMGHLAEEEHIW